MDPSKIDIIIAQDWNGLNAGSIFIRNTPEMRLFVDFWNDPLVDHASRNSLLHEQDLLLHLIFVHTELRKRVGWVYLNVINGYPYEEDTSGWELGDLVIHFPSCGYLFVICGG
jgi:alpha 1,2-galactosyltransferase